MVTVKKDLTGLIFEKLTVVKRLPDKPSPSGYGEPIWQCQCACGNLFIAVGRGLRRGNTRSCGCMRRSEIVQVERDLVGLSFGEITVISRATDRLNIHGKRLSMWNCLCSCGNSLTTEGHSLKRKGGTKSCGCSRIEGSTIHGLARADEYSVWIDMRQRCSNPKSNNYAGYGARGITVSERWNKFENFFADMGERPTTNHSIDRIDNSGNYEPSNCRWATTAQQSRNKRTNVNITILGDTHCLTDWCNKLGLNATTIAHRVRRTGLSHREAILFYINKLYGVTV